MPKVNPLIVSSALVLSSSSALLFSAIVSYSLKDGEWFQRSGSLCVLFSVILELHHTYLRQLQPSNSVSVQGRPAVFDPPVSRLDVWFHRFAWFGIVFGTIVWGYGDIVF